MTSNEMDDTVDKRLKLTDVWRTCNKIRAAIHRIGIDLWHHFDILDPKRNTLISESKFLNVFGQQLRGIIGLAEEEITELTDYFRVQDGRIAYTQLCKVIHENIPDHTANPDLVTGLEWNDPTHCNRLSPSEHRRLCVMMTKIAHTVRLREMVLRPYFQDYELVAKNVGTVTLAHFSRVLHFVGVVLSADDFSLLVKRFMCDSYTVNFIKFVEELEEVVRYLDGKRLIDRSDDVLTNFPGRIIDAELPKLPRPETGVINIGAVFGKETSFHSVLADKRAPRNPPQIILRIQRHVLDNQCRVADFFQPFDKMRCGYITVSQFRRGLDQMGISGIDRLYLSDHELLTLTRLFIDPLDPSRVEWKRFELDIDDGLTTVRCLDKKPYTIVEVPPVAVAELPHVGQALWSEQTEPFRAVCDVAMLRVREKISKRKLYLEPLFRDFDRLNIGHVSRSQLRQVMMAAGIILSDEEMYAMERRFRNDMGFGYARFLAEADPREYADLPKIDEFRCKQMLINAPRPVLRPTLREQDIVQVMAKIKGQVVRRRLRIAEFVELFDEHRELCIKEADFRRGLNTATVFLTEHEVDLVCKTFRSPLRPGYVDYKRFCAVVEEAFQQPCLERAPLIVPLQHFPSEDSPHNFLNFDERALVSQALQKLSKCSDYKMNLRELCTDYDRANCGSLNQTQFLRVLTIRGLHNAISSREFEMLCKCFAVERGWRQEVDYRTFLRNLDLLAESTINYPFENKRVWFVERKW